VPALEGGAEAVQVRHEPRQEVRRGAGNPGFPVAEGYLAPFPGVRASPVLRERGGEVTDEFFHVSLPLPGAARAARRAITRILDGWGAGGDVTWTAGLLATELVTNAERFSQGEITMTAWRLPGLLVIEVSDEACTALPERRAPGGDSESGRGLVLVSALSREFSFYFPRPGWKTVYCTLEVPE
jgi:Histidine kinase-like ATPase domain